MSIDERSVDLLAPTAAMAYGEWAKKDPDTVPVPFSLWGEACRGAGGGQGVAIGWYVVIGGDTKQGKTLTALQCAGEAVKAGRRVGFVNLEMSVEQLASRLYSQLTGITAWKIERGSHFCQRSMDEVVQWLDALQERHDRFHPFLVNQEPLDNAHDVIELMEEWYDRYGVRVFVVDYMQLVRAPDEMGIASETIAISREMRQFRQRCPSVLYAVSQFNNEGGNDQSRPPHAGSLYGGRRIVQDSDQTVLLDHSRREALADGKGVRTWLLLKYQRHGPAVDVPIEWRWRTLSARQAEPDEEHLWPE